MRTRDWLIEQGLAKPGSRGRISKEATAALAKAVAEGIIFDSPAKKPTTSTKKPVGKKQRANKVDTQIKVREQTVIWGYDKVTKTAICFDTCAKCNRPIQFCTDKTPSLPAWLDSETFWTKP